MVLDKWIEWKCDVFMSEKVIKDIRYFESSTANIAGNSLPTVVGELYDLPKGYVTIGEKFALLLRERAFLLTGYDHLYINLSTYLPDGESVLSERISEKWFRYLDYGLDPKRMNDLSDEEKMVLLIDVTCELLLRFCVKNEQDRTTILEVAELVRHGGEAVDIVFQSKKDKVVQVKVILNILNDGQCKIFVCVEDYEGNTLVREQIALAEDLNQAAQYAGTILIRKNRVVIKPKNNVFTKDLQPTEIGF